MWSSPMVPEVSIETQTRLTKGQKLGRAEAIPSAVVYFQRYHCLSLSVAYVVQVLEKKGVLTLKTNLVTYCQKPPIQSLFFHKLFEAWVVA